MLTAPTSKTSGAMSKDEQLRTLLKEHVIGDRFHQEVAIISYDTPWKNKENLTAYTCGFFDNLMDLPYYMKIVMPQAPASWVPICRLLKIEVVTPKLYFAEDHVVAPYIANISRDTEKAKEYIPLHIVESLATLRPETRIVLEKVYTDWYYSKRRVESALYFYPGMHIQNEHYRSDVDRLPITTSLALQRPFTKDITKEIQKALPKKLTNLVILDHVHDIGSLRYNIQTLQNNIPNFDGNWQVLLTNPRYGIIPYSAIIDRLHLFSGSIEINPWQVFVALQQLLRSFSEHYEAGKTYRFIAASEIYAQVIDRVLTEEFSQYGQWYELNVSYSPAQGSMFSQKTCKEIAQLRDWVTGQDSINARV